MTLQFQTANEGNTNIKNRIGIIAIITFFALLSANSASAYVVDYNHTNIELDMGNIGLNQSGIINNFYSDAQGIGSEFGNIPAYSVLTFIYSLPGLTYNDYGRPNADIVINGTYNSFISGNYYSGSAATGVVGIGTGARFITYGSPYPLLNATASIDGTIGILSLINTSPGPAQFSALAEFLSNAPVGSSLQYSVSAVPLPPSFGMFIAALLGLFSLSYRKRTINTPLPA